MIYLFKRLIYSLAIISLGLGQSTILKQSTFSNSAINSSGDNSKLRATVGQPFVIKTESENTILSSGFWGSVAMVLLDIDDLTPIEFSISNAYPNPFNPTVNIDFSIPEPSNVDIKIYDLLGRNIFTHKQNFANAGTFKFQWHGLSNEGLPIASGVYLIMMEHKNTFYKQKITFLK
mgnify:FL=1